jgi:hypothetical protein
MNLDLFSLQLAAVAQRWDLESVKTHLKQREKWNCDTHGGVYLSNCARPTLADAITGAQSFCAPCGAAHAFQACMCCSLGCEALAI